MINEFYVLNVYKGDRNYFNADGTVNPKGGPSDGMIRTEDDMKWLQAMTDAGYKFYPKQGIGKSNIWYGDIIYATWMETAFMVTTMTRISRAILKHRSITLASRQICHGKALTSL